MAIREVLTSFTFEQQRQMINLIGTDVGDAATLLTPTNVLVSGVNEIVNGDVDLINQTHGMDDGTLASPSLFWDSGQGFYKVDANKIGLTSSLSITGNLEVDGDITFRAGAASGGTLTFGDLNTDNIVFNAELTSSIVPDSTANYNLGSATKQWNNIWIDGTASIDTLTVDENSTFTGYLQVDSGDVRVPSTQDTVDLFDDYATTVEAFGAGTDIRLGATTGTLTLRNPTIVGSETTQALFNTVATQINAFGAATTINMGVSGGGGNTNFNILSDDVACSGKIAVNGGELLSSANTFNLLINNNDVIIGNASGSGTTTVNTKIVAKNDLQFTRPILNHIYIPDNRINSLSFRKTGSSTDYLQFRTDTGNERVVIWKDLYVVGNLDISGTTTTIDSTTLTVEDKNIELANVASPSDTTADGGGITLKGATDKTITYSNTSGLWETNIGLKVTGSIESTSTVRVDHSNNAGSDILARFGNANNSGTNSAHLLLANGYYASPTDVDGTGAAVRILSTGEGKFGSTLISKGNTSGADVFLGLQESPTGSFDTANANVTIKAGGDATFGGTVTSNGITQYTLPTIGNGGQLGYDDGTKSLRLYANSSTNSNAKIQFHFNQSGTASMTFAQDGTISDSIGPLRRLGQSIKSGNYTLVASDAGKHIRVDNGSTITIPDQVFASGDMITIVANSSSDVPITQGSGLNLYNASDGTTGSKTQAARTVSTILFAEGGSGGKAYISGGGLS
tara:strand:- start:7241 stop:9460 length:2220 start_codon:yes stop_codon:yes gene_type:complete